MKLMGFVLLAALGVTPALAQAEEKDAKGNAKQEPRPHASPGVRSAQDRMTDARLIALLHRVNEHEVAAGMLAQRKGGSAIKEYGRKLVADHTRADQEVLATAKKAGLAPNDSELVAHDKEMLRLQKNKMQELQGLSGTEFDKAFAQEMSRDHDHMISTLRDAKKQLSAPLREFVDQTIPMLEEHKDLADKAARGDRAGEARRARPRKR